MYTLALAFGIGMVAGLRSLMAPAVVGWAARLGVLNLSNTPFAFMASGWAIALFSALAILELIGDKLPQTPSRTAPLPLGARFLMGALCGACLCAAAHQPVGIGAVLGGVGGLAGAFLGYQIRKGIVTALKAKDFVIALAEDLTALGLACFLVTR